MSIYVAYSYFLFLNIVGLLEKLCIILMASGVPADVLTETIHTVSEVIRGNQSNQEYFASVMAPSNPPRLEFEPCKYHFSGTRRSEVEAINEEYKR